MLDSMTSADTIQISGIEQKILQSYILFHFSISHPWTHTLSTGRFVILPIKQKLCSEQHLCILGAIMHISNKRK